jgi:acyl-[acyl-carrier-protein]-phospholipid O-acyltransferase / long-chain-fatty-acid--[acyl-carrier-protein] ligase
VSIRFGAPLRSVTEIHVARQAIARLGVDDMDQQKHDTRLLPQQMIRACRRNRFRLKIADTLGTKLTGAGLLTRTFILRRLLGRLLGADEKNVGLLIPPSAAGVVANAALAIDRRVAVNLNYTVSSDVLNECIRHANIKHVITTKRLLERISFQIDAKLIHLEDLRDQVRWTDKLLAAFATWAVPAWLLERWFGLHRIQPDDLLTIIFTSGSTGQPKGVMLSHYNIASNIDAFRQVLDLRTGDVMLGVLPFFHSFGYTVTLWTVLTLDPTVVYHYSPLEARPIGQLCRDHGVNLLVAAPTFLRCWQRRCEPEDFAKIEFVIAGAEKLSPRLCDEFEARFKVRPVEGYGTTELSPVVSVNIPPSRSRSHFQRTLREGSVGLPLPGVSVKVVDLDTHEDLGPGKSGMLLVRGPNVMQGYLDRPDLTAEVVRDGWYVTGDVAMIDADGFIHITGRESRFSKIGGEMVPHMRIEETITKILNQDEDEQIRTVVTSVPDPRKSERLVVLHTGLSVPPEQLCRMLAEHGLPPLWIPSPDSYRQVESIPVLGTGKLDLKRVTQLANELFPPKER